MRNGLYAFAGAALLAWSLSAGSPAERTAEAVVAGPAAGAEPCPRLVRRSPGLIEGGCEVRVDGELALTAMTLVGPLRFARCDVEGLLRVGGDARTALSDIAIIGQQPCNDVTPCFGEEHTFPLEGRVVARPDGSLLHVLDACFDTCLGRFAGELELPLRRSAAGWRMDAQRAVVGLSGWELDGALRLRDDLALRVGRPPERAS